MVLISYSGIYSDNIFNEHPSIISSSANTAEKRAKKIFKICIFKNNKEHWIELPDIESLRSIKLFTIIKKVF